MHKLVLLLVLLVTPLVGCGTLIRNDLDGTPPPFGGTTLDLKFVGLQAFEDPSVGGAVMALLGLGDLPLSLAADTLCLPWTLSGQSFNATKSASAPRSRARAKAKHERRAARKASPRRKAKGRAPALAPPALAQRTESAEAGAKEARKALKKAWPPVLQPLPWVCGVGGR